MFVFVYGHNKVIETNQRNKLCELLFVKHTFVFLPADAAEYSSGQAPQHGQCFSFSLYNVMISCHSCSKDQISSVHLTRDKHLQFLCSMRGSEHQVLSQTVMDDSACGFSSYWCLYSCTLSVLCRLHSCRAPASSAALSPTWRWSATSLKALRSSPSCSAPVSSIVFISLYVFTWSPDVTSSTQW